MRIIVISDDETKACVFEVDPDGDTGVAPLQPKEWPADSIARGLMMAAAHAQGWSK